ncbi:MAG: hypothetical protein CMP22_02915 [Rickettsiales bacterium]|nr:hypothetical protein [Rickettsiales bacterium]
MAGDLNTEYANAFRSRLTGKGILKTLFMPEIKLSFGTVGMTHRAFLSILASIFIQVGLLPYNHPARSADTIGNYSLRKIMGEAWFHLRTSKNSDFGQYGLFICVFLLFALAIMMIVTFIGQFAFSAAQASPGIGGLFSPPGAPEEDLGLLMIEYLIGAASRGEGGAQAVAMGQLLQIYSYGVLVIASFIIAWSVLSVVVDTAHTGKFFGGRHNPVWWPIRLVFALALLIPLGHGFSSGQYMVIQIAKWGSNFASQGWAVYVDSLMGDGLRKFLVQGVGSADIAQHTKSILLMTICEAATNNKNDQSGAPARKDIRLVTVPSGNRMTYYIGKEPRPQHGRNPTLYYSDCGKISFAKNESEQSGAVSQTFGDITDNIMANSTLSDQMFDMYKDLYVGLYNNSKPIAQEFADTFVLSDAAPEEFDEGLISSSLDPLIEAFDVYEASFVTAFDAALAESEANIQQTMDNIKARGWPTASMWYYMINSVNNGIEAASASSVEAEVGYFKGDELESKGWWIFKKEPKAEDIQKQRIYVAFDLWWNAQVKTAVGSYNPGTGAGSDSSVKQAYIQKLSNTVSQPTSEAGSDAGNVSSAIIKTNIIEQLFGKSLAQLTLRDPQIDPIVFMMKIGHYMIHVASVILGTGAMGALLTSFVPFITAGNVMIQIYTWLAVFMSPFIISGVILSVILPMTPFIRFVFAISSWLIAIVEAIVMVPIIALGHLRTDGEGIMGPMLQGTYVMMLQLLLRPMLILLGLVISMSLVTVTVGFVNELFVEMISHIPKGGGGAGFGLVPVIKFVGYGVMYGVLMYGLINSSFKIIDLFPEAVAKYLGTGSSGGLTDREDGDFSRAIVASAVFASNPPSFQKKQKPEGDGNEAATEGNKK